VSNVKLNDGIAQVVVPDRQLSLAIGKDGQNARLAAKLTGCRIDIRSASVAAAEKAAEEAKPAEAIAEKEEGVLAEAAKIVAAKPREREPVTAEKAVPEVVEAVPAEAVKEPAEEFKEIAEVEKEEAAEEAVPAELKATLEPLAAGEEAPAEEEAPSEELEEITLRPLPTLAKSKIRFAEDIFNERLYKSTAKAKRKKKGLRGRGGADEGLRLRKVRQTQEVSTEQDES
jgi:N utilization substance protein A